MKKTIRCVDHYGKMHDIPASQLIIRVSATGILGENKKYLMVRDGWSMQWEFPGGGVKIGEKITEALEREFIEETGLAIKVGTLIDYQEDFFYAEDRKQAFQSVRFYFRVKKVSGTVKPSGNGHDSIEVRFVSPKELTNKNTKLNIYAFLKKL